MCEQDIIMGGCYHNGVAWGIGYYAADQFLELHNEIFTTFDSGINGGVAAELKRLHDNFDPSRDIPKFAVALKPIRIVKLSDNSGCDICGTNDRIECCKYCQDCLDDETCPDCDRFYDECCCDDYCEEDDYYEEDDCKELYHDTCTSCNSCLCKNSPRLNPFDRARLIKKRNHNET